eukprot:s1019_g21.t1
MALASAFQVQSSTSSKEKTRRKPDLRRSKTNNLNDQAMIQEFLRPEFRYKLRDALDGSEGDMVKQAHARRNVCMEVEIPLLAKFGYEATEESVHQHSLALGKLLHDCPDLVEKNQTLTRLVNPTMDVYEDDHIAAD